MIVVHPRSKSLAPSPRQRTKGIQMIKTRLNSQSSLPETGKEKEKGRTRCMYEQSRHYNIYTTPFRPVG